MNSQTAKQTHQKTDYQNWEPPQKPDVITQDDLISAWQMGWNDGRTYENKVLKATFEQNIAKAKELTECLFDEVAKALSINVLYAYFKIEEISKYSVLFLVENKDFSTQTIKSAYLISQAIEDSNKSESFEISFSFYPQSENTMEKNIWGDGFQMRYVKTKKL